MPGRRFVLTNRPKPRPCTSRFRSDHVLDLPGLPCSLCCGLALSLLWLSTKVRGWLRMFAQRGCMHPGSSGLLILAKIFNGRIDQSAGSGMHGLPSARRYPALEWAFIWQKNAALWSSSSRSSHIIVLANGSADCLLLQSVQIIHTSSSIDVISRDYHASMVEVEDRMYVAELMVYSPQPSSSSISC